MSDSANSKFIKRQKRAADKNNNGDDNNDDRSIDILLQWRQKDDDDDANYIITELKTKRNYAENVSRYNIIDEKR